jgi:hypothetical protein
MSELDTSHPNQRYTLSLTRLPETFDVVGVGDLVINGANVPLVSPRSTIVNTPGCMGVVTEKRRILSDPRCMCKGCCRGSRIVAW